MIHISYDGASTLHLTSAEYLRLQLEWEKACQYTTQPPTFEHFVRAHQALEKSGTSSVKADQ